MVRRREENVLVAIINNQRDFKIVRDQHWYRIPVATAPKRFPPDYLAFYQTKVFGPEKWAINYLAKVLSCELRKRMELLPDEPYHPHASWDYYKILVGQLEKLPCPIISKRWRRIIFIPTTMQKLLRAEEINDLFDESPLEDRLWKAFKENGIQGERQFRIDDKASSYFLDFAIFCQDRKLDVECDGDAWHSSKERIPLDNARDNSLTSQGWGVLRFASKQINNQLSSTTFCIKDAVNRYGGLKMQDGITRLFEMENQRQLELFSFPVIIPRRSNGDGTNALLCSKTGRQAEYHIELDMLGPI